jgi:tRNA nucleotidyltransferase (CCA-adding enzyme)
LDLLAALQAQPAGAALLEAAGDGVYLVGGAVRDLLLGRTPRELDVVVEGDAEQLAATLGVPVVHSRFGTATIELAGARIDFARSRRERYPAPGVLPEVEPAPLAEDLRRRDFTVNAIALSLGGREPGELHAVPYAFEDLQAHKLRVLHEDSFRDDPTRLLRLARYCARLGFEPEQRTAELARAALSGAALQSISGARIGAELRLALVEPDASAALTRLGKLGVLAALNPRLRHDASLLADAAALLPAQDGRLDLLLLAGLLLTLVAYTGNQAYAKASALLDRLEFPAPDRDRTLVSVIAVPRLTQALPEARTASTLRDIVAGTPPEGVALAGAIADRDRNGEPGEQQESSRAARRWLTEVRHVRLQIGGEDLLAAGVPEGPEIGRRLEATLRLRLDGALAPGRDAELQAALEGGR